MKERDRNLLFGVFAVQLKKVSPAQLMEAAGAWAVDPSRDLPERLVDMGVLAESDRDLIDEFVDEAVRAYGGDSAASLEAFGGERQVFESFRGSVIWTRKGWEFSQPPSTFPTDDADLDSHVTVHEVPGRYREKSEHGRGGMGRVLLVHDEVLGRDIVLKELLPVNADTAGDEPSPVRQSFSVMARFLREAKTTSQLEHSSVVPVYELGRRVDNSLYYTMKLVRGRTLSQALKEGSTLRARLELLPHFIDLCQALAYAHSRGVIHRDLKPANVMVGEFGETVVIDWGLAKTRGSEDVHVDEMEKTLSSLRETGMISSTETAPGDVLGTPAYMPPEQARGEIDRIDERSDIYSLGVILYEILTGRVPFISYDPDELMDRVMNKTPPSVTALQPGAPPELVAICKRAMQKDPDQRYQSAKEVAEEVQRFQSGALVQAYDYPLSEPVRRFVRKHRPIIRTVVAGLVVLFCVAVYSYVNIWLARGRLQGTNIALERKGAELLRTNKALEQSLHQSNILLAQDQIARGEIKTALRILGDIPEPWRHWEWGRLQFVCRHAIWATLPSGISLASSMFSRDGRRLISVPRYGLAELWDIDLGKKVATFPKNSRGIAAAASKPQSNPVTCAALSPDGCRAFTVSSEQAAVWEVESGKLLATLSGHSGPVNSAAFSPDGHRIVTTSGDRTTNTATVWDVESGEVLTTLSGHSGPVNSAAFSPDGRRIVTASWDRTAKLWDADSGEELLTLAGHSDSVSAAAFSPEGRRVATASWDKTAKVWDTDTGEEIVTLWGHSDYVESARFSKDGCRIVTASWDKTAKVWDTDTGKELTTLRGSQDSLESAAFGPDGQQILTVSSHGKATRWFSMVLANVQEPAFSPIYDGPSFSGPFPGREETSVPVLSAAFKGDGRHVITACEDGGVRERNPVSGKVLLTFLGHSGQVSYDGSFFNFNLRDNSVSSASFSPDGRRVVTLALDEANVWNAESGKLLVTLSGHSDMISSAAFGPDGGRIVTASADNTAKVWDAISGTELVTLSGHSDVVDSAAFSPDGCRILTTSRDKSAKVWDAESGKELLTLVGYSEGFTSAVLSPDNHRIVSTSFDEAKVWDADSGEELKTLSGTPAVFSPDGSRVITICNDNYDNTLMVWDAESGSILATFSGHFRSLHSAVFSPDGRHIVTTSFDEASFLDETKVWSVNTGIEVPMLPGRLSKVRFALFISPDGHRVVTGSSDGTQVWDMACVNEPITFSGHSGRVNSAAFSPDGRLVVTSSEDELAKVWNAQSGNEILALSGHSGPVCSVAFSPDGHRVVTYSRDSSTGDGSAKVWDAESGKELMTSEGDSKVNHNYNSFPPGVVPVGPAMPSPFRIGPAMPGPFPVDLAMPGPFPGGPAVHGPFPGNPAPSPAVSPDGRRVIIASEHGGKKVWDTESGKVLYEISCDGRILFSPDGDRVLVIKGHEICETESGKELVTLPIYDYGIDCVVFSRDGCRLVTANGNEAQVWDVKSGRKPGTLSLDPGPIQVGGDRKLSMKRGLAVLDSGSNKEKDLDTKWAKELAKLSGHSGRIRSVAFSPDGRRVVTASEDKMVKVWDTESGKELLTLQGHSAGVNSVAFSQDGYRLVTASDDGTAKVWEAMPWRADKLPGNAVADLDESLELWNRQRITAARESKQITK